MITYMGLIGAGTALSKLSFFAYNKKKYTIAINLYKKSALHQGQQELVFTDIQRTTNLKKSHQTLLSKQFDPSKQLTKGVILRSNIVHSNEQDILNIQVNFTCVNLNDPIDNRKNDFTVVKIKESFVLDKEINTKQYSFEADGHQYTLEITAS